MTDAVPEQRGAERIAASAVRDHPRHLHQQPWREPSSLGVTCLSPRSVIVTSNSVITYW